MASRGAQSTQQLSCFFSAIASTNNKDDATNSKENSSKTKTPRSEAAAESQRQNQGQDEELKLVAPEKGTRQQEASEAAKPFDANDDLEDDDEEENFEKNEQQKENEYWHPKTISWFKKLKAEIDSSAVFPSWAKGQILPKNDPLSFKLSVGIMDSERDSVILSTHDFCLPTTYFWVPELVYPMIYQSNGRPPCKFHGTYSCVQKNGWVLSPRHCYDATGVTALIGKKYYCSARKQARTKPWNFRGYDQAVIENSPDYVQAIWKAEGFSISHRGAVAWKVLESMNSCLMNGIGVSGYHATLVENYKKEHFRSFQKWRAYVDHVRTNRPVMATLKSVTELINTSFPEFDSFQFGGRKPTSAYLLSRVILLIESSIPYYEKRIQMIDGKSLSGDHSFKVAKLIALGGARIYTAMYTMMNEYGQVPGFWFTYGTSMTELDTNMQKLALRYELHGFKGPHFVTTDRCCQERDYWKKHFKLGNDDFSEVVNADEFIEDDDYVMQKFVNLPKCTNVIINARAAEGAVGEISTYLASLPSEQRVIAVDCEWTIGSKKAHVLQIGLSDGSTYVFHLARMKSFPAPLKNNILQEKSVKKVGNRIFNDVAKLKEWGVELFPTIELGKLAFARGVSPTRNPALDFLVDRLFHAVLEKGATRTSHWGSTEPLSLEQIEYAARDVYATIKCYQKLMTIMDPKLEKQLKPNEVTSGMKVVLYNGSWRSQAAQATIVRMLSPRHILVKIGLNDVTTPSSIVESAAEFPFVEGKNTLDFLSNEAAKDKQTSFEVPWKCLYVRKQRAVTAEDKVQIEVIDKPVMNEVITTSTLESMKSGYSADTEPTHDDESSGGHDASSVDEDSKPLFQEEKKISQSRLNYFYRRERVKQDLAHIFFRFERVLSKEHGCYQSFVQDLRDALFIPNFDDIQQVKQSLKEKQDLDDEGIEKKFSNDYKFFLQRVRRHVPAPPELESRYCEVINTYAKIRDAKTGKELFSNQKAWNVHKSTLKHIRRNCLSDVPGESYYIEVGRDRDDLPLYRCIRGTSALEGLHQKLRQLVRGFQNSPRLARALIYQFIFRFNHDSEIRSRSLSKKYEYFYDGKDLEEEIEKMHQWSVFLMNDDLESQEWIPSSAFATTGEIFGLPVDTTLNPQNNNDELEFGTDSDIENEAAQAIESLLALSTGVYDEDNDGGDEPYKNPLNGKLSESSCWLCDHTNRRRPVGRVTGIEQWEYFKQEYKNFQGSRDHQADNYSFIDWSGFAKSWNKQVDQCIDKGKNKWLTYKNAALLQDAWKTYQKRANEKTTMLPIIDQAHDLRKRSRDVSQHLSVFPDAVKPQRVLPVVRQIIGDTHQIHQRNAAEESEENAEWKYPVERFQEVLPQIDNGASKPSPSSMHIQARKRQRRPPQSRNKPRCRTCGHEYTSEPWRTNHTRVLGMEANLPSGAASEKRSQNLLNRKNCEAFRFCTVPIEQRIKGFPVPEGEKIPRRSKHKSINP